MPTVMMCGDFNLPFVNWSIGSLSGSTLHMQRQAEALIDFMNEYCLQQWLTEPTRINNILDLFMTNNSSILCQVIVLDTVVSDHRLILVGTYIDNVNVPHHDYPEAQDFAKLNFNSNLIEWQKLDYDLLQVDWASEPNGMYPSEMLKIISDTLLSNCSKYIPIKGERRKKSVIPKDRKILMRKRTKINHRIMTANTKSCKETCSKAEFY